ncbi:hypothetical protein HY570_02520 [Candidatus Micrarchaeota archaeon]|nr:hypothetical protein [Candidatus Micrarchaeota archaeon]
MVSNRKGQAAMEYLMTYGWAILVIILVLALLLYLGVFAPSTPEACRGPAGWTCSRTRLTTDAVLTTAFSFPLRDVTITRLKCTQESGVVTTGASAWSGSQVILRGDTVSFTLTCHDTTGAAINSFVQGQEYRGRVNVQFYYNDEGSAATRQEKFELIAKAVS